MKKEKISIILAVYNGEKWLEASLASIYQQTYENFEVICINDGSTDDSEEICIKYKERYQNFIYIKQENHGLAYSRNVGISNATGDYVTFIDADDLVHRDLLSYLMSLVQKYRVQISYTKLMPFEDKPILIASSRVKEKVCNEQEALKCYFKDKSGNVCAGLFRRSLFCDIRFADGMLYEDNIPKLQLIMKAKNVVFSNAQMYYYRIASESITRSRATYRNLDIIKIGYVQSEIMRKEIPEIYPKVRALQEEMIAGILYWNLLQLAEDNKISGINWEDYAPISYIKNVLRNGLKHGFKDRIRTYCIAVKLLSIK